MTKYKGSLELNWINKDKSLLYEIDEEEGIGVKPVWVEKGDIRVSEPRILKLKEEYGDPDNDNMLIKGDNLLALKTLVEEFKNREEKDKVKCIYIDPPFNTGSAFEYYDDNLEHSQWLTMMRDRLYLLKQLLRKDGLIFIHIDYEESHYLKILCDEVFSRKYFLNDISIKDSNPSGMKTAHRDKTILKTKTHILVYKNTNATTINPQYKPREKWDTHFSIYISPLTKEKQSLKDILIAKGILGINQTLKDLDLKNKKFKDFYLNNKNDIYQTQYELPNDVRVQSKSEGQVIFEYLDKNGKTRYAFNGRRLAPLSESLNYIGIDGSYKEDLSLLVCDFWDDIDFNNTQNEGGVGFPASKKPERLIGRILSLCTGNGDLVLDFFLGSGTTAAVSHKMKRKWIGIEIGNHAKTHCFKRLMDVIDGRDDTGITQEINWKGGGGFRYYEVGDSIIKDIDMNWDMTLEEMSRSVFMNFDYSFIEGSIHCLEEDGDEFYLGKQKGGIAICLVTKDTKIIRRTELNKLVKDLSKKYPNQKVTIFTNMGVAVKPEELSDKLDVKKIPESILKKYRMV